MSEASLKKGLAWFFIGCAEQDSKTLRTRRSLETVLFSEPYWVLARGASQGTKYEMLFERSEFIEWFEEFVFRPPSSGRFRTLSFASVFFLVTERKWREGEPSGKGNWKEIIRFNGYGLDIIRRELSFRILPLSFIKKSWWEFILC